MIENNPAHHKLGASTCERWWNCPGSTNLIEKLPKELKNESTEYSVEGTIAHALASSILHNVQPDNMFGRIYYQDGFKVEVTDEMLDAVQTYIDYLEGEIENHDIKPGNTAFEQRVEIPGVGFGTADACLVVPFDRIISPDYKHGKGIKVQVEKNKQAMYYAFGAYLNLPKDVQNNLNQVELVIVQPRAMGTPVSSYTVTIDELTSFGEELVKRAQATCIENAPLNPGPWCHKTFCPSQAVCPALRAQVMNAVGVNSLGEATKNPLEFTPEQLAEALEVEDMVKSWAKAISTYALRRAENGTEIPGWKIVEGRSTRKWVNESEVENALLKIVGLDIYEEQNILSPTQMEKAIKKANVEFDLDEFITKSTGNKTLARSSDKRATIQGSNSFEDMDLSNIGI